MILISPAIEWLRNAHGSRGKGTAWAYRQMAQTDWGKAVMRDLAAYSNVAETSFVPGDPHQTAFNEGRRDLFLHLCQMAQLTPDEIQTGFPTEISNV